MRSSLTKKLAALVLCAGVILPVAGYSAEQKVVNVYSARHYDSDKALYDAFTQATGIQVRLVEAKAEALLERLKSEGSTSPADILLTTDVGNLWRAEKEGLFLPIKSPLLESNIPASLRHPENLWFGLSQRSRVFVVAKATKLPEPRRYSDLADPKWRGRVCVRSSSNVYNQSLTGAVIAHEGVERAKTWVAGLVANLARPPQGGDVDQIKAVAAGECDVALVNHYYLARMIGSKKPEERAIADKVRLVFPEQGSNDYGSHVNISGGAVLKTAHHVAEAQKFLEFMVSDQAQNLFAQAAYEYPVKKGVMLHPILTAFGAFKPDTLNVGTFGQHNETALKIADEAGWK